MLLRLIPASELNFLIHDPPKKEGRKTGETPGNGQQYCVGESGVSLLRGCVMVYEFFCEGPVAGDVKNSCRNSDLCGACES